MSGNTLPLSPILQIAHTAHEAAITLLERSKKVLAERREHPPTGILAQLP